MNLEIARYEIISSHRDSGYHPSKTAQALSDLDKIYATDDPDYIKQSVSCLSRGFLRNWEITPDSPSFKDKVVEHFNYGQRATDIAWVFDVDREIIVETLKECGCSPFISAGYKKGYTFG